MMLLKCIVAEVRNCFRVDEAQKKKWLISHSGSSTIYLFLMLTKIILQY